MGPNSKKILVLIPAFNEAENLGGVIKDIRGEMSGLGHEFDILVVDDGSTDGTASVAATSDALVIKLPLNGGIGVALQTGFKFALEYDYNTVVRLDADGQHPAAFIGNILASALSGQADLVIGSRFITGKGYQATPVRRVGIVWFSFLIRIFLGKVISDPTSGFQAINRRLLEMFAKQYASDYPEVEALVNVLKKGFKIEEVAIEMKTRMGGRSSIDWLRSIYYALKVTMIVFLALLRK
jgi:glycosyltransferase involved in cell wall biosynthesis